LLQYINLIFQKFILIYYLVMEFIVGVIWFLQVLSRLLWQFFVLFLVAL